MEKFFILFSNKKGQSLIEILIALTIAVIIISGVTVLIIVSMRSNTETKSTQISTTLGQELIDSVKSVAEQDWHLIYDLNKGAANKYYISSSTHAVVAGTETILNESKPFTRYFYAENVRRNSCGLGNIVSSATTTCTIKNAGDSFVAEDPSTQKITAVVEGEEGRSGVFVQYISRTRNKAFVQTSWGGGSGQNDFSTTTQGTVVNDKFSTSTENIDFDLQPGSIKLKLP